MDQLKSIQVLRALAALAVMVAHINGIEARHSGEPALLPAGLIAGVSGVDLFFVISGFIMVWVAGDAPATPTSALKFLFARTTRIYPLWWLFAAAMAGYFLLTYGVPWDAGMLASRSVSGEAHLLKSFFLIPQNALPVLPLGWTLIHEMYFYVVFAFLLLLPKPFRIAGLILWAAIIALSMVFQWSGFFAVSFTTLALYPMTMEFLMGAAIGWVIKSGWTRGAWPAFGLGLVWLGVAITRVDFSSVTPDLPTLRTLAFGPAFALIIYGLVCLEQRHDFGRLFPNLLVEIGDWSYSLYLGHFLLLNAFALLYFPLMGREGPADNIGFLILGPIVTIIFAGATYKLFEQPLLNRARALRKHLFVDRAAASDRGPNAVD